MRGRAKLRIHGLSSIAFYLFARKRDRVAAHSSSSPQRGHPREPAAVGYQHSETSIAEAHVRDHLILCVDDEVSGLQLRKIILESRGYRVLIAACGAEGLKLFAEHPVDLVVLDFLMPEMKGDEVAEHMREIKPDVPIVMLSAYYDLPARVDLLVDARIVKGESTQNLIDTVAMLLPKRSAVGGE